MVKMVGMCRTVSATRTQKGAKAESTPLEERTSRGSEVENINVSWKIIN